MKLSEPTSEQCSHNSIVFEDDAKIGRAIWYPQMGGYVGKAVAVCDKRWSESGNGCGVGGCIDVYVWHDGDFPFGDGVEPVCLHHCDPEQFIDFGKRLSLFNGRGKQ